MKDKNLPGQLSREFGNGIEADDYLTAAFLSNIEG